MPDLFLIALITRCHNLNDHHRITLLHVLFLAKNGVWINEYDLAMARGIADSSLQNQIRKLKELGYIESTYNTERRKSKYRINRGKICRDMSITANLKKAIGKEDKAALEKGFNLILDPEFQSKVAHKTPAQTKDISSTSNREVRYLKRKRHEYTHDDIFRYFRVKYRETFKKDHRTFRKHDKSLHTEHVAKYNAETACDVIDFALEHKDTTNSLDYQSFCKSIDRFHAMMVRGNSSDRKTRIIKR